jgi:hypothetical protein
LTFIQFGLLTEKERRLGKLLDDRLKTDPLYPHFEKSLYFHNPHSQGSVQVVRYKQQNFLDGLDRKVEAFLNYVDECIAKYGHHNVLI